MDMPTRDHSVRPQKNILQKVLLAVAIVAVTFGFVIQMPVFIASMPNVAAVISSVLIELTNADRTTGGLATLAVNPLLTEVAEAKARDMAENGYFAHTSPDGKTPWYWFSQKGYTFAYAGENLAVDFTESIDVQRAWMQSSTHRANIVGTQFSEIGIAVAEGTYQGRPATFVVQVFATPSIPARIATSTPPVKQPTPRVVRDLVVAPEASTPAIATTLPTTTPAASTDVLGQSAGAYLVQSTSVPWWFKLIQYFF